MSEISSIFDLLKSQNGTLISFYARPRSFTSGGVSTTINTWMEAFSEFGLKNLVQAYMHKGLSPIGQLATKVPIKHFLTHRVFSIPTSFRFLKKEVVLVYLHEGWTLSNFMVATYCFIHKIPYAIMPHGVYESEIVRTLKCLRFRMVLENFVLRHSKFVHLFFDGEKEEVWKICRDVKIVVAPTVLRPIEKFDKSWIGDGNYFLYAGRIDPTHKGLDLLIECWKLAGRSEKLLLAGPDFNGGAQVIQNLISQFNLQDNVLLLGNLDFDNLTLIMRHAKGFLHISRWESYGRSAIDSIRMGIPTLISNRMQISNVKPISNIAYITSLEKEDIISGINFIGNLEAEHHKIIHELHFEAFSNYFNTRKVISSLFSQV